MYKYIWTVTCPVFRWRSAAEGAGDWLVAVLLAAPSPNKP